MAFLITRDYIADLSEPEGTNCNAVGVAGPRDASEADIQTLKRGGGHAFRMFDDDGNRYYSGRYLGDADSEDAFEPLDCFGTPNAGCTHIKYRTPGKHGKWVTL